MTHGLQSIILFGICVILSCCSTNNSNDNPLFTTMQVLDFANSISEDTLNVYDFHYLYNGGGVGIADFNNDDLPDIFMGGNMTASALYMQQSLDQYTDVAVQSGIATTEWINGISIIDINHDGWKDIYLSVGGPDCDVHTCRNLLYINQSTKDSIHFTEKSEEFGLNVSGYSQQGLFLDVDLDGDLDLYQLQNYVDPTTKNYPKPKRYFSDKSHDKLLINQEVESGQITFIDKSVDFNITLPGFGLGVAMTDVNQDGYPDIYVANDFISDDILYINQKGKSFKDESKTFLKHTSYNSMGVDIADLNMDGDDDIIVMDMLPYDNQRQKTMLGGMNYDKYLLSQKEGYNTQLVRNTVQISNGMNIQGEPYPYSEIGALLEMHETDWSWAPLIADFDNDTDADVYVTNGYGKNITDLDFVNYNANTSGFGTQEALQKRIQTQISNLEAVKLPNRYFEQTNQDEFLDHKSYRSTITNGAAYGDLDNDGDLDLVLNHLNEKSEILRNNSQNNFVTIRLIGSDLNIDAIGAVVKVTLDNGRSITKTVNPVRGYLSSMSTGLIFGLGDQVVDSVEIRWPDMKYSYLDFVEPNTSLIIHKEQFPLVSSRKEHAQNTIFDKKELVYSNPENIEHAHKFSIQPLLLKSDSYQPYILRKGTHGSYMVDYLGNINFTNEMEVFSPIYNSKNGRVQDMVVGDLDGDSSDEIAIIIEQENEECQLKILEYSETGWDVVIDKSLTLANYSLQLVDLYDDKGKSLLVANAPHESEYPLQKYAPIMRYMYKNGSLIQSVSPISELPQVVINTLSKSQRTMAAVGEWMAPLVWNYDDDKWTLCDGTGLDSLHGMWQTVKVFDIDNDGDQDIFLGNLGTNNRYKASFEEPMYIIAKDLDNNGSVDPIMSLTLNGTSYTYHTRDDISKQVPNIKKNYATYSEFAKAPFTELLDYYQVDDAILKINTMESVILEQLSPCKYKIRKLPKEVQYTSINNVFVADFNNDGLDDLALLTNLEQLEIHNGKLDALNGLILENKGNMEFEATSVKESGFYFPEPSYDMVQFDSNTFLVSTENGVYSIKKSQLAPDLSSFQN